MLVIKKPMLRKLAKKIALGTLIALFICLLLFLTAFSFFLRSFSSSANLSFNQIYQKIVAGKKLSKNFTSKKVNFLILGLDSGQQERGRQEAESGMLTDTIILLSCDTGKKTIKFFALPRDLWVDSLKTKINALYYYGEIDETTTGEKYARETISKIVGLPIDYYLLIDFSSLKEIVDILGGLEINVPETFDDYKFPKPHSEKITNGSPSALFEHVHFDKGLQTMDGERVLKYVRSRQSENLSIGTDLARSQRQQQVIQALISKLTNPQLVEKPKTLGELYSFWKNEVKINFTDEELIAIGLNLVPGLPKFETINLPISNEATTSAILYHPPNWQQWQFNGQWVYIPNDPTWYQLQQFVRKQLD